MCQGKSQGNGFHSGSGIDHGPLKFLGLIVDQPPGPVPALPVQGIAGLARAEVGENDFFQKETPFLNGCGF